MGEGGEAGIGREREIWVSRFILFCTGGRG